jgi:hypothetical protein
MRFSIVEPTHKDCETSDQPVNLTNINGRPQRCTRHENSHQRRSCLLACQQIVLWKSVDIPCFATRVFVGKLFGNSQSTVSFTAVT